jgi:hypothetical protein
MYHPPLRINWSFTVGSAFVFVVSLTTCTVMSAEEKAKYAARCPIKQLKAHLLEHGLATEDELKAIDKKVSLRTLFQHENETSCFWKRRFWGGRSVLCGQIGP